MVGTHMWVLYGLLNTPYVHLSTMSTHMCWAQSELLCPNRIFNAEGRQFLSYWFRIESCTCAIKCLLNRDMKLLTCEPSRWLCLAVLWHYCKGMDQRVMPRLSCCMTLRHESFNPRERVWTFLPTTQNTYTRRWRNWWDPEFGSYFSNFINVN